MTLSISDIVWASSRSKIYFLGAMHWHITVRFSAPVAVVVVCYLVTKFHS